MRGWESASYVSLRARHSGSFDKRWRAIILRMKTTWHESIGLWLILPYYASLSRKREI